jgi:lipopolysaccharide export system permease protein
VRPRLSILDRYLTAELGGPFLFGVAAFTAIMTATSVLFELIRLMVRFGIPLTTVLQVVALKLPQMAFYSFPMSMLLASLLAFGRLSGDSEVTALKACGVGLGRIVAPVATIGLLVSALTVGVNEFVVPEAEWQARNILYEAQNRQKLPTNRDNIFYQEFDSGRLKRVFYARSFDGQTMQNTLVQEFEGDRLHRIIRASRARNRNGAWVFEDGSLYQLADNGEFRTFVRFREQIVNLRAALLDLSRESRSPTEMSLRDLYAHARRVEESGERGNGLNELWVQWHQKLSVPFASVVFVLIGAPLGLKPQRSSSSLGLGLSILIIFVYYLVMFISMALGQTGTLPPWLAGWLPNTIGASIGLGLIWRAAKT